MARFKSSKAPAERLNSEDGAPSSESADTVYTARLEGLRARQAGAERTEMLLGRLKLGLGALVVLLAVLAISHARILAYLVALIVLFVVLAVVHERVLRSIAARGRQLRFYAEGLRRMDGTWRTWEPTAKAGRNRATTPTASAGEEYRPDDHAYAADLDLFGQGSLFHLLSTARTQPGEQTLAGWLLTPAAPEVIGGRHAAVQELAPKLDLRERLATAGEDIRATVHAAALTDWAESRTTWPGAAALRVAAYLLGGVWVATIVYWATSGNSGPVIASSVVNLVLRGLLAGRIADSLAGLNHAAEELAVLSSLLKLIEQETLCAPLLTRLRAELMVEKTAASTTASQAIARLGSITQLLDATRNMVFKPLDYGLLWTVHFALAADRWRSRYGVCVRRWLAAMGEFEALSALASYCYEHPSDVFPEILPAETMSHETAELKLSGRITTERQTLLEIESFAHPLLDSKSAIRNDLRLASGTVRETASGTVSETADRLQLVVISGPNMAGKSTFLRGLGVNVVLAQAGAPVRARAMRLTPLAVAASISVSDSLASGISRFYAEIRRVKLVSDLADGPLPVLFLLDELLSGTNSHDRFIGTQFVVRSLLERGAVGIVTTHDLALTVIPEGLALPLRGMNSHFEDRITYDAIEGDRLSFDYRLTPGIVQTSNALALMRSIGLKVDA